MTRSISALILTSALAAGVGCQSSAVGDPCQPEAIPQGGFDPAEAYIEASSVQCRTRVCMVYKLNGFPDYGDGSCDPTEMTCASEMETNDRVYCTCRCDKPEGVPGSLCECPSGYVCEEILQNAGVGLVGSYCVLESTAEDQPDDEDDDES